MRFVLDLHPRSHIGKEQFMKLKWIPVECRVNQIILCQIFNIHSGLSPSYMKEHFTPISSIHSYPTRFSSKAETAETGHILSDSGRYATPIVKSYGKRSFAYIGCKLWNSLPQNVRDANSTSSFKIKVKQHFLSSVDF